MITYLDVMSTHVNTADKYVFTGKYSGNSPAIILHGSKEEKLTFNLEFRDAEIVNKDEHRLIKGYSNDMNINITAIGENKLVAKNIFMKCLII